MVKGPTFRISTALNVKHGLRLYRGKNYSADANFVFTSHQNPLPSYVT